jgi:hypothetical protein
MIGAGVTYRLIAYRHSRWVESFAQNWLSDHIQAFEDEILRRAPETAEQLLRTLWALRGKIKDMTIPDE